MDAESFTALALRVLSREATEDERRALDEEVAASASRREEFNQLKLAHEIFCASMPMTEAVVAAEPQLPAHRINELRTAVRQHFGPAAARSNTKTGNGLMPALRWIFAGGGVVIAGLALVLLTFANRSIEVGIYGTNTVRGGDVELSAQDVPTAHLITFEQDAPFDQWQRKPLEWNQRAKIWVDNERDLLVIRRKKLGRTVMEAELLAPTTAGQREQIKKLVETLNR
jgi:hypothetical protein